MGVRAAITVGLLALALSACSSSISPQPATFSNPFNSPAVSAVATTPQPISRAELMSKYAKIVPFDKSATPAGIDDLAHVSCSKLREGVSTDQLITLGTSIYKTNSTEVMVLLVSYQCPEFLKDFK